MKPFPAFMAFPALFKLDLLTSCVYYKNYEIKLGNDTMTDRQEVVRKQS